MDSSIEKTQHAKRIAGAVGGVVAGVLIALLLRPEGLGQQGVTVLAILAGAIVWWICEVLPEFATALLMVMLFVLLAGVNPSTAFTMFSNSTWWILVGAFSIGLGMRETGLLKRMALAIVSRFPKSFAAQVAGFITCGTLLGPLIPSMAAKVSLLAPLAMEIGDDLGYKRQGRQDTGLFLAMFTGVQNVAPAVVSASVIGYALLALYPSEVQAQFDFVSWLVASLPWFIPFTLANFALITLIYRPRGDKPDDLRGGISADIPGGKKASQLAASSSHPTPVDSLSAAAPSDHSPSSIIERRRELGPMSASEKWMSAITAITVLLWITQGLHGVAAWIPAVGALVAMVACRIVNKANFGSGLGWTSLVFIGVVLGLGNVFAEVGINNWVVGAFGPAVTSLASNPYLFIAGIAVITVVARFIVVSQIAFLNIFMAFVIPIAVSLGISPWVIGMACYSVLSPWFVKYQNPVYLAAYYSVDGKMAKHSELAKYCVAYTAASIACLLVAVPFWQGMGLI